MTGVEKVQELAQFVLGARYGRVNLLEVHSCQQWQDVIGKYCLAYGSLLRGVILSEGKNSFNVMCIIGAWKGVMDADKT